MTLSHIQDRVTPAERVAVRCVDSDVHPVPRRGVLQEYIPEPLRSKYFTNHAVGELIYYDAPDYAHAYAMRLDTFPPDGEFACTDPDMAFRQAIMEAGADIAVLEPTHGECRLPEATAALSYAHNTWQAEHWLDSRNNWHERWRGSICVAIEEPEGAAREIEKWAGHPYMVQTLIKAEPRPSWGDPKYDPFWAAATKHDIVVSCHLSRGKYETLPIPPVGFPSYNHDFMVSYSLLAANQVMSLIFDGVFDRFPNPARRLHRARVQLDPSADVADGRHLCRAQVLDGHQAQAQRVRQGTHQVHHPAAGLPRGQDRTAARLRVDGVREDPAVLLGLPALDL